jgi:phage terminase large subunit GpA-like protein
MRYPIVFALQGSSSRGKPVLNAPKDVDVLWNGQKIPGGCKLWTIGTDTAKSTIYSRVRQTIPGPGCYHWPIGTTDDYFLQLTAEKLVETHNKKGFTVAEWVKVRERNEALDLEVYNYAAALRAGVNWVLGPASPTPTPTAPKPAASSPSAQPVPADNDRPEILQLRVKTPEPLDRITEHHQRPTHSRRYERPNWLNR